MVFNSIEREWVSIIYSTFLKAIESNNTNEIKTEIAKLKNEYPKSGIHDLTSAINFLKVMRNNYMKLYEIKWEQKFMGVSNKKSTLVSCKLNGKQIYAIFDTAADRSFVSIDIAKSYRFLHLIDFRQKWTKIAFGLGEKMFVGTIHCIHIDFMTNETFKIMFPLMVMNKFDLPFLVLGLDFMNWFQCSIDYRLKTIYMAKLEISLKFISDQCIFCLAKSLNNNQQ